MRDTVQYMIGADAHCFGEDCGAVAFVVVDPVARKLTHLVVHPQPGRGPARLVPVQMADPSPDGGVDLRCTRGEFEQLEAAEDTYFEEGTEDGLGYRTDQVLAWPFFGLGPGGAGIVAPEPPMVPELRPEYRIPAGEIKIRRGERVHAADGEIGRVRGLVVEPPQSQVTHVLLDRGHLWGRRRIAIPIAAVTGLGDDGVTVRLTKDEIRDLPPVDVVGLGAEE